MRPEFRAWNNALVAGTRRPTPVATPAAGADWTFTFPGGYLYRVDLGRATYTTSKQAAERRSGIELVDPDGIIWWRVVPETPITAEKVVEESYANTTLTETNGALGISIVQLPEFLIPGGWKLRSKTFSIQTEDTYTGVQLMLAQMYDDYPGRASGALEGDHLGIDAVTPPLAGVR